MSTSQTPERPQPHRRRLTVASVATAVLLAGGGGAYWASMAAEPADDAARASHRAPEPPPLVLDGLGTTESGDAPGSGIAPGEPNPNSPVLEAEGELPRGPGSAAVFRPDGDLTRAEVQAIADALQVKGTPERQDGRWRVGGGDGSGPLLTVNDSRGGASWSYVRHRPAGDDLCGKPKSDGPRTLPAPCPGPQAGGNAPSREGEPVTADKAKAAVKPVLEPLHLERAELDASSTHDALRVVNAQPRAGGLPVENWTSSFTVDSAGTLVRGHGRLGDLVKGAVYPVMTAGETLKALNKHRGGQPPVRSCDAGPADGPRQGDAEIGGYPKADDVLPCVQPGTGDAGDAGERTATVTGAVFGLAAEYSQGKPVLVPAWTYRVRQQGAGGTYEVSFPAVEREYLRTPGAGGEDTPVSPGGDGQAPVSYTADGRTLTVTFWGGVCHDYRATAQEKGDTVAVGVTADRSAEPKKPCIMVAKKQRVTVQLDKPLGDREVVDARNGEELPRKK